MFDSILGQNFLDTVSGVAKSLVLALVIFIVGRLVIRFIMRFLEKMPFMQKADPTLQGFLKNFVKILLNVLLIISIIGVLGVPMASIVTVLASCGVAIGLAMQGALANLAGGIMLLVFRPFNVGDVIEATGETGIVKELSLFYTVMTTLDNRRVTIPNGSLMNANVINYSAEPVRRVDLAFSCAKSEAPAEIQSIIQSAIATVDKVLQDPEPPFARVSGGTNEAMEFTVRAWCNNADYWEVYFNMTQAITEAFGANGVAAPAIRVLNESK